MLGLLHRRSLLYLTRRGRGGYRGARWDILPAVEGWTEGLPERPEIQARRAVFLPGGGPMSRLVELAVPQRLPVGGFLAVALRRHASPARRRDPLTAGDGQARPLKRR